MSSFKVYHGAQILMCIYIFFEGTRYFLPLQPWGATSRTPMTLWQAGNRFWGNINEVGTFYASWRLSASPTRTALRPGYKEEEAKSRWDRREADQTRLKHRPARCMAWAKARKRFANLGPQSLGPQSHSWRPKTVNILLSLYPGRSAVLVGLADERQLA